MSFLSRLLICLLLLPPIVFPRSTFAQNDYYFQEEFNQERAKNILDDSRWSYYPNQTSCPSLSNIKESGGYLNLIQCTNTPQFPYIYTKTNPFPEGDYSLEIKFQYTKVTFWGTGIAMVDQAPGNGQGFKYLFGLGIWQDKTGPNMRISFDGSDVYKTTINSNPHVYKLEKLKKVYKIYFDNSLIFTSPETNSQIKALWIGNPSIQNPPIPDWTTFKVDYIRVTQLNKPPTPFLELPWDYKGKGLSFNEAANSINSFFDHEYPLLSSGMTEPSQALNFLVTNKSTDRTNESYSSHDGYDYGKPAKVNYGDPVLAAASGWATYMNSCSACGNAILIDHENGYQTRYYHLQKDGLITNTPGQKVKVEAGQQIGKNGATGNVIPQGEGGAHIHFMVIFDKDKDGNFENNLPDGVTDPFGWQSIEPDPWENYSFSYAGKNRTGNKSFYLWKNKLDNLNATLTSNGGVFKTERYDLNFPNNTTTQNLSLKMSSAPIVKPSDLIASIGSSIIITAKDPLGNLIKSFQNFFTLTVDFSSFDLTRYKTDTISLYSSEDGINWTKENTNVDLTNKKASAQINHMTYFALMAERIDITPPTTSANFTGDMGEDKWFRSDTTLTLDAFDSGLGTDYTLYRIEGQDWELYTSPLTFKNEGHYKVEFYSVDKDENIEQLKSVEFDIDKTSPEASIDATPKQLWSPNGKPVEITVTGNSNDKNLKFTKITVEDEYHEIEPEITEFNKTIRLEARRNGSDKDGRVYIIKVVAEDLAGNKTQKQVEVIVPHDQSNNQKSEEEATDSAKNKSKG